MAFLDELKAELNADPLGLGYGVSAETDASDAALMSDFSLARPVSNAVTVTELRQYLIAQVNGSGADQRTLIQMLQEFGSDKTVRGAGSGEVNEDNGTNPTWNAGPARASGAAAIVYMLTRDDPAAIFDINNAVIRNLFLALGPNGGQGPEIFTNEQLNEILALSEKGSRAAELFFNSYGKTIVTASEVAEARTLP